MAEAPGAPGVLVERVPLVGGPQESYALYLPSSYSPARTTPSPSSQEFSRFEFGIMTPLQMFMGAHMPIMGK